MKSALRSILFVLACAISIAVRAETDSSEAAQVSRAFVVSAIAADLASHFSLEGDLQLEMLRPFSVPERAAKDWQVVITEYPQMMASSLLVRYRLLADNERAGEFAMTFRAALWRDAWAARQPVNTGETFDASALDARPTDFLRDRDAVPAGTGDASYCFARPVQTGRLITWRDIARRPLVKKGDVVEVTASEGALSITMKALAMQNGAEGDAITVRNPDSRRDFTAFVVDENHVQVRF